MMLRHTLALVACSSLALAQEAEPVAEPPAPPIPAANSQEARVMVSQAIEKLASYGRGEFVTTTTEDQAFLRNAGLPIGAQETDVDGGWHRDTVWGDYDGREFVVANGRMLAKVDGEWRLRRDKLSGGVKAPFLLDPMFLVDVLKNGSATARNPVNVQEGKLRGKRVVILTARLVDDDALELFDSGAVPSGGGGVGGMIRLGGLGGAMEPPRPELETYVAFWVDPESSDLVRLAVRTYSTDQMAGQIQVAIGGAGGGAVEADDEDEEEDEGQDGKPVWKRGFPKTRPAKDQSVTTFRADFKRLGLVDAPELDDRSKALLRLR